MKTKKPDIFLGITMVMLVLAMLLCVAILYFQKTGKTFGDPTLQTSETPAADTGETTPSEIDTQEPAPTETTPPAPSGDPIDEAALKAALDDSLDGLTSEWQVVVMDPVFDTRVASAANCDPDDWMTANNLGRIYVLAAAFQKVADGELTQDQILDDAKAMITANDAAAGDRLTELVGGKEAVKTFATSVGSKMGFNRNFAGGDGKNYVTAQQGAMMLDLMCRGQLVSEDASKQMLDILMTPTDAPEIDPGLTGENAKAGFLYDVEDGVCTCALGVVDLGGRQYVVSAVCNLPVTTDGSKKKITELISLTQPYFE